LSYLVHWPYSYFDNEKSNGPNFDKYSGGIASPQAAISEGCTVRQMMLQSIERAVKDVEAQSHKRRLRLDPPIVPSTGKPFDLSNAQIYDVIEFP